MSSGRVQLAAIGLQDEFLTGTPDVTYFVKKFNRHTKFALEILDIPFYQTNINFGSWVNIVIPRNGQLIRTIYVKLVLPALSVGGYSNGIGNAIINYADLVIGGQTIERINGEYMQIYDQTFISDSQQTALTYMVGTTTGGLGPATAYTAGTQEPTYGYYPRTFIVPLSFYFMRNEALAIPLCALTRSEVEIRIQFQPLENIIAGGYVSSNVVSTTSINWSIPPNYTPAVPPATFITGPVVTLYDNNTFTTVTWLPVSSLFACLSDSSYSNIYYYDYNTKTFDAFTNFLDPFAGYITGISQNNAGVTMVISGADSSNTYVGSPTVYRTAYSLTGLATRFGEIDDAVLNNPVNYIAIATDGVNFAAIGNYSILQPVYTYTVVSFSSPSFIATTSIISTSDILITIAWAPGLQAYIIGSSTGTMYTYKIGSSSVLNKVIGAVGPYTAYSSTYGQIYNVSPVICSNTLISNTYASSFDGGVTWSYTVPYVGSTAPSGISYSSAFNQIFVLIKIIPGSAYSIGIPININMPTYPVQLSSFRASLPVEYVFLADEEIKYIQGAKIDYVITQLQLASTVIPAGAIQLSGYKLNFINPTKELFFIIQDSNVVSTNDYYNYLNTSTGGQQLVNLELQFNGEDIISSTVADALYLGKVQFMNNHTRLPNLQIYNYSFSIDPENYLPTGQVNMSRIMNQNIWINLTANPNVRNIRVYARSYNILRVQNGLAGVLFIDNNFI